MPPRSIQYKAAAREINRAAVTIGGCIKKKNKRERNVGEVVCKAIPFCSAREKAS